MFDPQDAKGHDVLVVGGGDSALDWALALADKVAELTLIHRRDELRASKAMQHRVDKTANIEVKYNTEIDEVLGEKVVEGVRAVNNKTGKKEVIDVTGVFIAIGHKPNTDLFKDVLQAVTAMDPVSVSVVDVKQSSEYLSQMPLFAGFWSDRVESTGRIIIAQILKHLTNETIRRIEDVTGKLSECTEVSVCVQNVFYSAGRIIS